MGRISTDGKWYEITDPREGMCLLGVEVEMFESAVTKKWHGVVLNGFDTDRFITRTAPPWAGIMGPTIRITPAQLWDAIQPVEGEAPLMIYLSDPAADFTLCVRPYRLFSAGSYHNSEHIVYIADNAITRNWTNGEAREMIAWAKRA